MNFLRCCPAWKAFSLVLLVSIVSIVSVQAMNYSAPSDRRTNQLKKFSKKLKPLHAKMDPVQPGDWLATHKEKGQSFQQYFRSRPNKFTDERKTLYVLPLGEFDENQKRIVDLSAQFLGIYFQCEVKTLETLGLDEAIPAEARRVHPSWGVRQIKTSYILDEVLPPRLPNDAFAMIAFTTSDLYPQDDWNFVFGQAMFHQRVGVWSIIRNGDPETEFKTCLIRTLRTATHETGHMFSIKHCTAYKCNMCGTNSLEESDRRPLHLCPECVTKIWWATGCDPQKRFEQLIEFCREHEIDQETEFYSKSLEVIKAAKK